MTDADAVLLHEHHLLLLDAQSGFSDVLALLGNLDPRLAPAGPEADHRRVGWEDMWVEGAQSNPMRVERAKLTRHSAVAGPVPLDAEQVAGLGLPDWVESAVVLFSPTDREAAPPPDWYRDTEGRWSLFPEGLPDREEGRNLDMLVAVARRLQTAVRVADEPGRPTGRILTPDYGAAHDLTVYSSLWLAPELLLQRVAAVAPSARFPAAIAAGMANPDAPDAPPAPIPDGYAIEVPVELDGRDLGEIEVGVYVEEYPPRLLVDLTEEATRGRDRSEVAAETDEPQAPAFVGYQLRWIDPDFGSGEARTGPQFNADRASVAARIDAVAGAILRASDGVVFDSDGFLVAEHQLT